MSSAVLSPCEKYRYRLDREVQTSGDVFGFFGVNPSTADEKLDDQTVKKMRGFTQRNGGRRFIVGNVFSLRAADVSELSRASAVCGPDHMRHLQKIVAEADILVPCWGSRGKMPRALWPQLEEMLALLRASGKPIKHLGLTQSGDPRHPVMLGYDTPLVLWR
ncbi:DUF1643 domain-containing protein (plasmid) [Achromobacter seleniivolatilans]|uniref:DUF1643 domain-containing protein n=1 Tax=Achromobacter seleniivolatilans TaxID=3047478 RepID=A0ABY9MAC9_9BURK|nr:DUF1643 domain-containing protein [Achromobacter sp. R39]WMD23909.1 DUF1643 domain-containing protein [Achromobacter sp. R39]